METKKDTQQKRILRLLKQRPYVTNLDLNDICFRYTARIHELRNDGWNIQWASTDKRGVNKYWLIREADEIED